ncbi:50S ribosomal protein L15e [uncultured archaeon]|nr:50S ribosomal protein L15e [uncultured archaeon]
MALFKHLSASWRENGMPAELKRARLIQWRREPVTLRIEHPTRLDRAKAIGFKHVQGIFMVRQRVTRGSHKRPDWSGGRHTHNMGAYLNMRKDYQSIAEVRAGKCYPNCEVLNSYYVLQDGKNYWYEVVMADRALVGVQGRVFRGLTSAGKRTRGLHRKGMGSEKTRPSRRAHSQ